MRDGWETMKVLVCGGRDYDDRDKLFAVLDRAHFLNPITTIISGCAKGADDLGARWAHRRGIGVHYFMADWSKFGRAAGPMRNQAMLVDGNPDIVIAFPGGRGTADMVRRARAAGVPVLDVAEVEIPPSNPPTIRRDPPDTQTV